MKTSSTKKKATRAAPLPKRAASKPWSEMAFDERLRETASETGADPLHGALIASANDLRVCIAAIEADEPGEITGAGGETVSLLLRIATRIEAVSGEMHRRALASEVPS